MLEVLYLTVMRFMLWVLIFLLVGSLGLNFYLLVEEITPLKKELYILREQNKKLYDKVMGTSFSDTTGKRGLSIKEGPSLLKGVSAVKDTFILSIQTLKIFKKHKVEFSKDGMTILNDFVKSLPVKQVKKVDIAIYQGPYRTLTGGRLKTLERYFIRLGVPRNVISLRPDNSLKKWTTMIRIIL